MQIASQQSPYTPGIGDVFRNQHWDEARIQTGVNRYTLFATPQSATKSEAETSMTDPGQFPTGVQFFIERIGFRLLPADDVAVVTTPAVLNTFFSWCGGVVATFNLTGKQNLGQWHLSSWLNTINLSAEGAVDVSSSISTATSAPVWYTVGSYKNGDAIPLLSRIRFDLTLQNFRTATPAGLNNFRLVCLLDGFEQRRK